MLRAAFKAFLRMLKISKILIFPTELEPGSMITRFSSSFKIPEGGSRVVRNELWIDSCRRAHGAHIDSFGNMRRNGTLWLLGSDLEYDGDRHINELLQLGIVNLGRSYDRIGRRRTRASVELLCPIDKGKNISTQTILREGSAVGCWIADC